MFTRLVPQAFRFCSALENFIKVLWCKCKCICKWIIFSPHRHWIWKWGEKPWNTTVCSRSICGAARNSWQKCSCHLLYVHGLCYYFLPNFTFPGYARLNKYICASNENPCTRECIEATINLILITERNLCS